MKESSFHEYVLFHDLCLFISPDLDGHRALKMKYCLRRDPQKVPKPKYDMFTYEASRSVFRKAGPPSSPWLGL